MARLLPHACIAALALASGAALGAITVLDDSGQRVTVPHPVQRVVALSPHATELLFAAGAGKRVAGVVKYSDFPAAATALPQVGDSNQIDIERVLALKPDLLVVWHSGNTARQLEQLRQLGVPMFHSEPQELDQIAADIGKLGQLLGTEPVASQAAAAFRARVALLRKQYAARAPVRVFYQIWEKPLFTLGGRQIVNDVIGLCGGVNIFAGSTIKAPQVAVEEVLGLNPEAVLGGERHDPDELGVTMWKPYTSLLAQQRDNLFTLHGDLLARPGPRMAEGAAELCEKLERARQRRP